MKMMLRLRKDLMLEYCVECEFMDVAIVWGKTHATPELVGVFLVFVYRKIGRALTRSENY